MRLCMDAERIRALIKQWFGTTWILCYPKQLIWNDCNVVCNLLQNTQVLPVGSCFSRNIFEGTFTVTGKPTSICDCFTDMFIIYTYDVVKESERSVGIKLSISHWKPCVLSPRWGVDEYLCFRISLFHVCFSVMRMSAWDFTSRCTAYHGI